MFERVINSQDELHRVLTEFLDFFQAQRIFLFKAEMGVGKTTIIKQCCDILGSMDNFSSPTYSIVNEYTYPNGKIFHFDLYRLKKEDELFDLGFEEYINSGQYCFIEWPQMAIKFLTVQYVNIEIKQEENIRYFRAFCVE